MRYKLVLLFLLAFLAGFVFLYFEGTKIKYLSVFLPHREKTQVNVLDKENNTPKSPIIYGMSVDMSQLLPSSANYVVNSKGEDLTDIAHYLGINLFRITSVNKSAQGFTYTKAQWDKVLDKMDKNGIKALILVEAPTLNPDDYSENYLNLVKSYVVDSGVLENPDVYGIDIRNEPLLNDTSISAMSKAAKMIKAVNPNVLITVGGWKSYNPKGPSDTGDPFVWTDPIEGKRLAPFVDFYSLHIYEYDKQFLGVYPDGYNLTEYAINRALPDLGSKPILIEEFGAANGEAVTDQRTLGSPELQANAYNGVFQATEDYHGQGISGSVAFVFTQRNQAPEAGWAIAKDNGNYLFPAAYVLQKFALGKSDIPLNLPYKNVPNDYLLLVSDNNKTINVKVNDVIGFHLDLTKDYVHSLKISNPPMLLKTEGLVRPNNGDFLDATYHVTKEGSTTIKITGKNSGGTITRFTLNINASE